MSYGSNQYGKYSSFVVALDNQKYEMDKQVHVHSCEELILIPKPGTCTIVNSSNTVTVPTPAFIWNRAGSYHYLNHITDVEDAIEATYFPQVISNIPENMIKTDFLEDSALFALPLNEIHARRMWKLFFAMMGSPIFQRQFLFPCIFHQVSHALSFGLEPIRSGNINDYIFEVIKLLQEAKPGKLTTQALADQFHVGRTKLNDDFKRITNMSVHAYRLEQQLRAVRMKLTSSKAPIVQIAIDCGFTDESHLIRAFRARYGVTPGAFRKKYMGDFRNTEHASNYKP